MASSYRLKLGEENWDAIKIEQYDFGYTWSFVLLNADNTVYNIPDKYLVAIEWDIPNYGVLIQTGNTVHYSAGSNKVEIDIIDAVTINDGEGKFNVVVCKLDSNGNIIERKSTFTNKYIVYSGAINEITLNTTEVTTALVDLEQGVFKAESKIKEINKQIATINKDSETVKLLTTKLEQDIKTGQTTDTKLLNDNKTVNTTITNANNINKTLNTTITNANNINKTLNTTTTNANNINKTVNTTISEANTILDKLKNAGSSLNIEHMQVGGTNLLRSSALKKNMDYINAWYATKNVTIVETTPTPHGNRSFKITNEDTTGYFGVTQKINRLENNTSYTISVWVKPTSGNNGQLFPYITYKNSSGVAQYHTYYYDNSILTLNKWNKLTYTFTTGNDVNQTTIGFGMTTQKCRWHGYIGDIKLELGSHNSDWSPAPNDLLLWNYPVGSKPYISFDNTNPTEYFGGEWRQLTEASGRTPIFSGTGKDVNGLSKTFTLKQNGGEYTHKQTENELAPHVHGQHIINDGGATTGKTYRCDYISDGLAVSVYPQNIDTMTTGGGQAFNIMQPYIVFNIWIRTA